MVHDACKIGSVLLLESILPCGTAERERMFVIQDDVKLNVDRYYGEFNMKPYRVVFWENGRNVFKFDDDGLLRILKIGSEKYRAVYDSSGDLERVVLKSSRRRNLGEDGPGEEDEEDEDVQQSDEGVLFEHRRLQVSCDDCVESWEAVCDEGVSSVCDLVGYGPPLSSEASAAIDIMCTTFGDACFTFGGEEACDGQCVAEDDDGQEVPSGINACLDPTSDQYKCTFAATGSMRLEDCGIGEEDTSALAACFENFGKTNLRELYLSYNVQPTVNSFSTLPEDVFAGLTELQELGLGYLGLTSLPEGLFVGLSSLRVLALYYNELTTLPPGIFAGLGNLQYLYLYENNLVTLPDQVFADCASLDILNLDDNDLVGLPSGAFAGLIKAASITLRHNQLTTLPEGVFSGMPDLYSLLLDDNPGLQCVPTAEEGYTSIYRDADLEDLIANGICECAPAEAVMCDPGTSCQPGSAGYTCV